jgi:phospholipase/carboxylesterase
MRTHRSSEAGTNTPGRISARPRDPTLGGVSGYRPLDLGAGRTALLFVPDEDSGAGPWPLAVMLHGAGGIAEHGMAQLGVQAEEMGIVLLGPASAGGTWDVIEDTYGLDVELIDRGLDTTFREYAIDPLRLAIGGFSDGASYALSLGLTNGDLFTHVIAFSPGFMAPTTQRGRPRLFVSHGAKDRVLPVERCSRRMVPALKRAGYDVRYNEFGGGHTVPTEIAREAADWFVGKPAAR